MTYELLFIQDNTLGHAAKETKAMLAELYYYRPPYYWN